MASTPAGTWVVAVAGLTVQAVTLVVATVSLAHTATTIDDQDPRASFAALSDTVLGPLLYTLAAIAVGLFALLLVVAVALSVRAGGRFTGLVTALAVQVPVVGWPAYAVADGEDPTVAYLALFVGGGLVVLGALFPATWRWVRRPPVADPVAVVPG